MIFDLTKNVKRICIPVRCVKLSSGVVTVSTRSSLVPGTSRIHPWNAHIPLDSAFQDSKRNLRVV